MASTKIEDFRRNWGELATISAVLIDVSRGFKAGWPELSVAEVNRGSTTLAILSCGVIGKNQAGLQQCVHDGGVALR